MWVLASEWGLSGRAVRSGLGWCVGMEQGLHVHVVGF